MRLLPRLFANNERWARAVRARDPRFFEKLVHQQTPEFLWIGCSDSRVPANEIVGLLPGEMFVHRNVANVVVPTDLNCLSVLQYAVDVLRVRHVIVCGHYGCGGVRAALEGARHGLVDNWLQHVRDVQETHRTRLARTRTFEQRHAALCEFNVAEQVRNVCQTTIVQDAWQRGQPLAVHGWIYSIADGRLRDLGLCTDGRTPSQWVGTRSKTRTPSKVGRYTRDVTIKRRAESSVPSRKRPTADQRKAKPRAKAAKK
jgi:carbonic anhydrase